MQRSAHYTLPCCLLVLSSLPAPVCSLILTPDAPFLLSPLPFLPSYSSPLLLLLLCRPRKHPFSIRLGDGCNNLLFSRFIFLSSPVFFSLCYNSLSLSLSLYTHMHACTPPLHRKVSPPILFFFFPSRVECALVCSRRERTMQSGSSFGTLCVSSAVNAFIFILFLPALACSLNKEQELV